MERGPYTSTLDLHGPSCKGFTFDVNLRNDIQTLIHQISAIIVSMLAKVHISTVSSYYLNYSHTLYGHIMQSTEVG